MATQATKTVDQPRKPKRAALDYGPLPAEGYVRSPKVRAVLGGVSDQTLRNWIARGILPAPARIGPNVVAWPVEAIREAIAQGIGPVQAKRRHVGGNAR